MTKKVNSQGSQFRGYILLTKTHKVVRRTITVYDRKHLPTQDSVIMRCFPHVTTFQNDPYR